MNKIPPLLGTTLSGRAFRIPEDLPLTPIALIFGFDHEARHDVAAWKKCFTVQGLDFLSVPITPVFVPATAMSDTAQAMKNHVPPGAWESMVLVHKGGRDLLAAFGWQADAFAKVVLMAGGQVQASHGSGPFTAAAAEAFHLAGS
ncbi:MAG: hypothetical protein KGN80_05010 [Acidobacteriota bacterium]|nr:hypothetical protein [Acidobacteriota bacterium]